MDLGWRPEMRTEEDLAAAELRPPLSRPPRRARAAPAPGADPSAPDLPNSRPVPLKRGDLDTHDERFEYWDGDAETAWVLRDPTGFAHEHPSQRLAGLAQVIAGMRGAPIECGGTMDLELHGERGERWRILRADQSVYLHPGRSRLPDPAGMVVGVHDFPDVVLEVDHTTDVRRWKLGMYEAWGFPEVWVEVPEGYSASRPAGRRPGLAIHLLEGGAYRESPESRAFPGWRAEEIHTAMNEAATSAATGEVIRRVARALGERDGTGPDDTPWLRAQRQEVRSASRSEGYAEGRRKGYDEGRRKGRDEGRERERVRIMEAFARRLFASRGISGAGPRLDAADLRGVADEDVVDTLLRSEDEADFRTRIARLRKASRARGAGGS